MRAEALILALLGFSSCGPPNRLSGSLSDLFPLQVTRAEIEKNSDGFQVSYTQNQPYTVDLVIRLSVALSQITFKKGKSIDLSGEYLPGHRRATFTHAAAGEPQETLADVKHGELDLDEENGVGANVSGSFHVSFETSDRIGSGRDLTGHFSSIELDGGYGD